MIELRSLLIVLAVALLVPLLLAPLFARFLLDRGQVDRPDPRRNHRGEVPRGGGLLIALGMVLALLLATALSVVSIDGLIPLLILILALSGLGAVDDRRGLGIMPRIVVQAGLGLMVLLVWGTVEFIRLGGSIQIEQVWVLSALALIAFLWLINLHNFMDGSDGLASQQAAFSACLYAGLFAAQGMLVETLIAATLAAACLGFLVWNRPPARIFLGDSGSLLIGGLVAWSAVRALQSDAASLMVCILISSLFVVDATVTLLWRLKKGQRWYTPHRLHAYQRLIDSGWTHARVLLSYAAVNLFIVLPTVLIAMTYPSADMILTLGVVGGLVVSWWRIQSAWTTETHQSHG
ncbi:MAG: hypothetical protein AAGJ52_05240 [Pseudomonadota bacterium]